MSLRVVPHNHCVKYVVSFDDDNLKEYFDLESLLD